MFIYEACNVSWRNVDHAYPQLASGCSCSFYCTLFLLSLLWLVATSLKELQAARNGIALYFCTWRLHCPLMFKALEGRLQHGAQVVSWITNPWPWHCTQLSHCDSTHLTRAISRNQIKARKRKPFSFPKPTLQHICSHLSEWQSRGCHRDVEAVKKVHKRTHTHTHTSVGTWVASSTKCFLTVTGAPSQKVFTWHPWLETTGVVGTQHFWATQVKSAWVKGWFPGSKHHEGLGLFTNMCALPQSHIVLIPVQLMHAF